MLEELRIQNFRGFEDHRVPFRKTTIVVGANNAGKSTLVEALRLVALVADRFANSEGRMVAEPEWLMDPRAFAKGVSLPVRGMPTDGFEPTLFHGYADPPAVLTARYESGSEIMVFVGPEAQVYGVARDAKGTPLAHLRDARRRLKLRPIAVQPQVAPLLREERMLLEETVRRGEGTYLAPQHFRNQLWLSRRNLAKFRRTAEETWRGLQVQGLDGDEQDRSMPLQLRVRDGGFVGEVGLMGHGLQMWLQIIWFLTRAPRNSSVVLDEPDVYMHPDIQRRMLALVRDRFDQLTIATHSVELISDVDPQSILNINKREPRSEFVTELPDLQGVVDGIGTIQNLQVTRLLRSQAFCMVEGKDLSLLRQMQRSAIPEQYPIDLVPHSKLGGRGGWKTEIGSSLPKRNVDGQKIRSFALIDRDYFPKEEIADRYAEARDWGVQLRIWERKEIENYLLLPSLISRLVPGAEEDEIRDQIDELVEASKGDIQDAFADNIFAINKKKGVTHANKLARQKVATAWRTQETRWAIASGKRVIASLSNWATREFGSSLSPEKIARELRPDELHPEVKEFLSAVCESRNLRKPYAAPK